MATFCFHLHTKQNKYITIGWCLWTLLLHFACSPSRDLIQEQIEHGTIAYPFVDESASLGRDRVQEKFIIKSAAQGREYQIEIPGAARDYDVQIPIAELGPEPATLSQTTSAPTAATDYELTSLHPQLGKTKGNETALMDAAFGVAEKEGPRQNPSFTMGLAKINELYRKKNFEFCLVEINNLLAFFPNAPQVHKMKGTVLIKMRQWKLAELAWIHTLELDPTDRAVRRGLERLQSRIVSAGLKPELLPGESLAIPKPVGTTPPPSDPLLLKP